MFTDVGGNAPGDKTLEDKFFEYEVYRLQCYTYFEYCTMCFKNY